MFLFSYSVLPGQEINIKFLVSRYLRYHIGKLYIYVRTQVQTEFFIFMIFFFNLDIHRISHSTLFISFFNILIFLPIPYAYFI